MFNQQHYKEIVTVPFAIAQTIPCGTVYEKPLTDNLINVRDLRSVGGVKTQRNSSLENLDMDSQT